MFSSLKTTKFNIENIEFLNVYNNYLEEYPPNLSQHQSMGELYIKNLADVLKKFHVNYLPDEYTFMQQHENFNDLFYESIAWKGLQEHNVQAYSNLDSIHINELDLLYENFYSKLTKLCHE